MIFRKKLDRKGGATGGGLGATAPPRIFTGPVGKGSSAPAARKIVGTFNILTTHVTCIFLNKIFRLDFGAKLRTPAIQRPFYLNICCFFVEKVLCETIHYCGCDAPYLYLICRPSLSGIPNLNIFF